MFAQDLLHFNQDFWPPSLVILTHWCLNKITTILRWFFLVKMYYIFIQISTQSVSGSVLTVSQHLTHWGRVAHICVSNLTIIGSDNGLSPGRRQAIIWTNAGILLIGPSGTNFSEILIEIHTFSIKKMHLKMSSAKRRLFLLGLNELK